MAYKVLERRPSLQDFEAFRGAEAKDQTQTVLQKSINWSEYAASKFISDDEAGLLLQYDKEGAETQEELLEEQGEEYAALFVKALTQIHQDETVEYLLAMVDELLQGSPDRVQYFHALQRRDINPFTPFMRILTRGAAGMLSFQVSKSCSILSTLLSRPSPVPCQEDLTEFVGWLILKLETCKPNEQSVAVHAIKGMLRSQQARQTFVREQGIRSLTALLKKDSHNTQLLYLTGFCCWLVSFELESCRDAFVEHHVVERLIDVLSAVPRKKVVRIIFACLTNLLAEQHFMEIMVTKQLLKMLPGLLSRKWADDDLVKDLETTEESLQRFVVSLSSFDKYHSELLGGELQWTPVHNEHFWRENVMQFGNDNFHLVRLLLALLEADDDLTVEVACYDLGEFVRFHPDGRRVLTRLNGKVKMMALLKHTNPKVARQALLAVQKLMVHNWESIASSGGGPPESKS